VDVRYLTGFSGEDSVLVLAGNRNVMVTDSRYVVQLKQECPRLGVHERKGVMAEAVATVLGKKQGKVGVEAESVTVGQYGAFRRAVGHRLKAVGALTAEIRLKKDKWEIQQIRRAVRIAEEAMVAVKEWIAPGITERQVAARLDYEMAIRGSEGPSFKTIVAFGSHAAEPHAKPGMKKLKRGEPFLIDWGAIWKGYRSDLTRCFVVGKIPTAFADAYRWVLKAQVAAINAVASGVPLSAVDGAAREVLGRSGYPLYGHGTGHGIGLKVHEGPVVSARSQSKLEEGMVVTIEPGVYVEGKFGIRIEDDVLVTSGGRWVLSRMGKGQESLRL